jgi:2,5-furandicarboxylate decarboxylase 1
MYYTEIAEKFSRHDFQTVARALGHLHTTERLWQDAEGRMCERGSKFAAKPPGK